MGRKFIPTEIKKQKGTLNVTRQNKDEIRLHGDKVTKQPEAPEGFTHYALKEWDTVWDFLLRYLIAAEVDVSLVEAYCMEMGLYKECKANVSKNGLVFKGKDNMPLPSPYIKIGNNALLLAQRLGAEFGFSASSRAKLIVGAVQHQPKSKMAALRDGS